MLTPWRPFGAALDLDARTAARVVHTVSRPDDLAGLREHDPRARFVLEQLTSMRRHGMSRRDLTAAAEALRAHATAAAAACAAWPCTCPSTPPRTSAR